MLVTLKLWKGNALENLSKIKSKKLILIFLIECDSVKPPKNAQFSGFKLV